MSTSKVIIVTGASQGIGAETVNAFRAQGHRVVATSRSIRPSNDSDLVTVASDIGDPSSDLAAALWLGAFGAGSAAISMQRHT